MIPRRLAAGGKELTSDLPASPNQPQVPGSPHYSPSREPLASLSTGSLPACIPAQPPTSFICSQGADSQQTTLGPAPVCNSVQRLRVGCKSPHGHRVGQGPRAPPMAGGHWLLCLGCGHTKAGPHSRSRTQWLQRLKGPLVGPRLLHWNVVPVALPRTSAQCSLTHLRQNPELPGIPDSSLRDLWKPQPKQLSFEPC